MLTQNRPPAGTAICLKCFGVIVAVLQMEPRTLLMPGKPFLSPNHRPSPKILNLTQVIGRELASKELSVLSWMESRGSSLGPVVQKTS